MILHCLHIFQTWATQRAGCITHLIFLCSGFALPRRLGGTGHHRRWSLSAAYLHPGRCFPHFRNLQQNKNVTISCQSKSYTVFIYLNLGPQRGLAASLTWFLFARDFGGLVTFIFVPGSTVWSGGCTVVLFTSVSCIACAIKNLFEPIHEPPPFL